MRPSISVFFPAYNDAPSLPALLENTFRVLPELASGYEVIVVNDGSADNTAEVVQNLQRQYGPALRLINHPANRGYGGALRTGFGAASKDWVFYTDGDGQYDPGELRLLVREVAAEVGLVNGYKLRRSDPWRRIWIGRIYNCFARLLFRIHLRDVDCDFRLIRRRLLESVELTSTSGSICVELVRKLELSGFRVAEVGVNHYPRLHGRSQFFRLPSLVTTLGQVLRLWFSLTFSPPLQAIAKCLGWTEPPRDHSNT